MVGGDDKWRRAILLGASAGAARIWAWRRPDAATGLLRGAAEYSRRSARLLAECCDGSG